MNSIQERVNDRVESLANELEELEDASAIDYDDVEVTADLDGRAKEFTVLVQEGSPRVEINTTSGTVYGSETGHTSQWPVDSEAVTQLDDWLREQWKHAEPET